MIPLGSCSFGWAKMPLELTTITELRDPSEGLFVAGDLATRRVDAPVVAGGGIGSAPGARLSAAGPEPLRWARARRSIVPGFSEGARDSDIGCRTPVTASSWAPPASAPRRAGATRAVPPP